MPLEKGRRRASRVNVTVTGPLSDWELQRLAESAERLPLLDHLEPDPLPLPEIDLLDHFRAERDLCPQDLFAELRDLCREVDQVDGVLPEGTLAAGWDSDLPPPELETEEVKKLLEAPVETVPAAGSPVSPTPVETRWETETVDPWEATGLIPPLQEHRARVTAQVRLGNTPVVVYPTNILPYFYWTLKRNGPGRSCTGLLEQTPRSPTAPAVVVSPQRASTEPPRAPLQAPSWRNLWGFPSHVRVLKAPVKGKSRSSAAVLRKLQEK